MGSGGGDAYFLGHLDRWKVLSSTKKEPSLTPENVWWLRFCPLRFQINAVPFCIQDGALYWDRGKHLSWESERGMTSAWSPLRSLKSLMDQIQAVTTLGWFQCSLGVLFLGELSSRSS